MNKKPRIVLLNQSCQDVRPHCTDWLASVDAHIVTSDNLNIPSLVELDDMIKDADGLVVPAQLPGFPDRESLSKAESLRVISIASSGYEWFDMKTATQLGIVVANCMAQEGADAVAELTIGLLISLARMIPSHFQQLRQGIFERQVGSSLVGKVLGVIGLGNIGRAVIKRAAGFGMRFVAVEPFPDTKFCRQYDIKLTDIDTLLSRSDTVSLHVRLNKKTKGMIGVRELSLMKRSAFLLNTARKQLCDEKALFESLKDNCLAGAAMDDQPADKNSPLLELPNFICTPHIGNRTLEGMCAVFKCAVENAVSVFNREKPRFLLNPEVYEKIREF